jgi:hypothetical protein
MRILLATKKNHTSKETYINFRKKIEEKPWCEREDKTIEWCAVYKNILNKRLHSELRTINYKVANNGLAFHIKLYNIKKEVCVLCKKEVETRDHLFIQCETTKKLYEKIKNKIKEKKIEIDKKYIIYNLNLEINDIEIISIFKLSVWNIRNYIKNNENTKNVEKIFMNMFKRNEYKFM